MPTPSHEVRGMRISKLSPGRRTDTNTGGAQSRRHTDPPRHLTRPRSTLPAPPRPWTATVHRRPSTAPHSRVTAVRIADNMHRYTPSSEHPGAHANDGRTDPHKHAATTSGARHHAGHTGHRARAAHTQNPCPPACCSPICLPRCSRLAGQRGEDGDSSRGWRGG